jgi:hypothetical protein
MAQLAIRLWATSPRARRRWSNPRSYSLYGLPHVLLRRVQGCGYLRHTATAIAHVHDPQITPMGAQRPHYERQYGHRNENGQDPGQNPKENVHVELYRRCLEQTAGQAVTPVWPPSAATAH